MRPRIGQLIPWTIVLACALDAGTRLIPIEQFSFRAWEALAVGRGPTGPFEPDRVYANPLAYGDLARPQRFATLRQRRFEYFSTDAWGFRNTVTRPDGPVRWLLVGDSFGVSSGVRDASTLASQLARFSGERVYNGSSYDPLPLDDIRFTANRLGMQDGVVVYEYMERQTLPAIAAFGAARIFTDGPPQAARTVADRYRAWRKDVAVSRMSILAGWGWDAVTAAAQPAPAGTIMPQQGELPTVGGQLANGATMLFYVGDVEVTRDPDRRIAPDYLVWLHGELAKRRLELAVLIVPAKYQVYGPLLKDPSVPRPNDVALRRLADDLAARGVFAVNVTDALRRQAAGDLRRGEYDYFLDDTHWSDRGIAVAARTFVESWTNRKRPS